MKISVIIPVYNVEAYIDKCLSSVLHAMTLLKEYSYEIIIVNDGSTDCSRDIIRNYEHNENIVIIDQENRGLSAARNEGIKKALGEYICFIDSDDFVDAIAFAQLIDDNLAKDSDIIVGNYYDYYSDDDVVKNANHRIDCTAPIVKTGAVFLESYYLNNISSVVWRSIYRRRVVIDNNLLFKEGVYFEDVDWTIKMFYHAGVVTYVPNADFYFYRRNRPGSIISKSFSIKKVNDAITIATGLVEYSLQVAVRVRDIFIMSALFCLCQGIAKAEVKLNREQLRSVDTILRNSDVKNIKYKILIGIYKINTELFLFLIRAFLR